MAITFVRSAVAGGASGNNGMLLTGLIHQAGARKGVSLPIALDRNCRTAIMLAARNRSMRPATTRSRTAPADRAALEEGFAALEESFTCSGLFLAMALPSFWVD